MNPGDILKVVNPSEILRVGYDAIKYLVNAGIKTSKELTIVYSANRIVFRYTLEVGSRSTKIKGGLRFLQSKLANQLILDSVTSVRVHNLPEMNSLSTDFVEKKGKKTVIDIPKILKTTESEGILIEFEKQISKDEMTHLVPYPHISNTPLYPSENIIVAPIEVTTDYANLWYKQFDIVKIKEIRRQYTLIILQNNINELLSFELKHKLNEINNQRKLSPKDILTIQNISKVFKKFETDVTIIGQLSQAASTDKPKNVELIDYSTKTKNIDIHGAKLTLPDSFSVKLQISLDAKDFALSAKFMIDYGKIIPVIKSLSKEADMFL